MTRDTRKKTKAGSSLHKDYKNITNSNKCSSIKKIMNFSKCSHTSKSVSRTSWIGKWRERKKRKGEEKKEKTGKGRRNEYKILSMTTGTQNIKTSGHTSPQ